MDRRCCEVRLLIGLVVATVWPMAAWAGPPIPEDVKASVRARVAKGITPSIVVGLVDATGMSFYSHGTRSVEDPSPVDEDSIYEIGSITKTFTALLLADLVERGRLDLDDPIEKYLPEEVRVPSRGGKITLLSLTTHRSGLPRMPSNFEPEDPTNPFADYTTDRLYAFLSNHTLTRDVGASYEYSNVGAGLLGHALTRVAGKDYEAMMIDRICKPLGMESTVLNLTPELRTRLALGHSDGKVVPNWDLDCLAGAGMIRSSARDMLRFLAANLGHTETALYPAMQRTHKPRHDTGRPEMLIGMGWHIQEAFGTRIVWHNGGTGGYLTFCGFDPKSGLGAVVLTNSNNEGSDDIGRHLLQARIPLTHKGPQKARTEITLDESIVTKYAGKYFVRPGLFMSIKVKAGKLVATLGRNADVPMFPESETKFFSKSDDTLVTFVRDESDRVTGLIYHNGNRDMKANRIE